MEPILGAVAVVLALGAVSFWRTQEGERRIEECRRLVNGLGGYVKRPFSTLLHPYPTLVFPIEGTKTAARVSFVDHENGDPPPRFTDFSAPIRATSPWTLQLKAQSQTKLGSFLSLQDLQIGDPQIDELYAIKSDNPLRLSLYFAPREVKDSLLVLSYLGKRDPVDLKLGKSSLFIRKPGLLEGGALKEFIRRCAVLYRRLPGEVSYRLPVPES